MDPAMPTTSPIAALDHFRHHRPLRETEHAIRLLRLHAGKRNDQIVCTLSNVSWTAARELEYQCLSYCWGDATLTTDVILKHEEADNHCGCRVVELLFPATINLVSALRHLRLDTTDITIWADAICINQNDIAERGQQVKLMQKIYSNASLVRIWLGEHDSSTALAVEVMNEIKAGMEERETVKVETSLENGYSAELQLALKSLDRGSSDDKLDTSETRKKISAITSILSRPWFERVWVLQEVHSARKTVVHCGDFVFTWPIVVFADMWNEIRKASFVMDKITPGLRVQIPELWRHLTFNKSRKNAGLGLLNALAFGFTFKATDPRDHIFALFGMLNDYEDAADLQPTLFSVDYTKSVADVFTDVTAGAVYTSGSLEALSLVKSFSDPSPTPSARDAFGLPSWVPEYSFWTSESRFLGYRSEYSAAGTTRAPVLDPGSKNRLALRGVVIDRLHATSLHFPDGMDSKPQNAVFLRNMATGALFMGHHTNCVPNAVFSIWAGGVNKLTPNPYGEKRLEAYMLTLVAGRKYEERLSGHFRRESIRSVRDEPTIEADFAAHWSKTDANMSHLLPSERARLLPLAPQGSAERFTHHCGPVAEGRCFFLTRSGYMGICSPEVRTGDVVVVMHGAPVPYILRPHTLPSDENQVKLPAADSSKKPTQEYRFLGECYFHGWMHGEAIHAQRVLNLPIETFYLV